MNFQNNSKKFLIDTGSEISLFRNNNSFKIDKNDISKLYGIDDNPISTLGVSYLTLELPNIPKSLKIKFSIVDDQFPIPVDGILGLDFIEKFKVKLDFHNSKILITLGDTEYTINLSNETNSKKNKKACKSNCSKTKKKKQSKFSVMKITKVIILPPRSENLVLVETKINKEFDGPYEILEIQPPNCIIRYKNNKRLKVHFNRIKHYYLERN